MEKKIHGYIFKILNQGKSVILIFFLLAGAPKWLGVAVIDPVLMGDFTIASITDFGGHLFELNYRNKTFISFWTSGHGCMSLSLYKTH